MFHLPSIEVRLVAYDRPQYLRQVIDHLVPVLKSRSLCEVGSMYVVASVDARPDGSHNPDVVAMLKEVTSNVTLRPRMDCNLHVLTNLDEAADDDADCVLYLEDDILLAPDTLPWILSMLPIMRASPRVQCLTLFSNNRHNCPYVAYRNWHGFRASRWFTPWGNLWLSTRLTNALQHMHRAIAIASTEPWDMFVLNAFLQQEWLELCPLLSRAKHIGEVGRFPHRSNPDCTCEFWAGDEFAQQKAQGWH